ncbi:MAG: hypothetical protein FJ100_12440 [Deltaproteobacteria bacterium]|nr:hypothetical protein [Deltaproteobacteria bacterium]
MIRSTSIPCAALATWLLLCGFGPYRPAGLGAGALGMGDAQVATGAGTAALYANPAGMSQVQHGVLEAGFARSGHAGSGAPFAALVDSTSAWGIAAGVGYAHELGWTTEAPHRSGSDLRLGLSVGGQSDAGKLLIGGSGRRLSALRPGASEVSGWTGDVGAILGMQQFRVGAVVHNVSALDAREAPRRVGMAVGFVGQQFIAEAAASLGAGNGDTLPADAATGPAYRVGSTVQVGPEGLQLRAGYQFDNIVANLATKHWICAGLAWRTPRLGFDVALAVDGANDHRAMVSASLTVLIPDESEAP